MAKADFGKWWNAISTFFSISGVSSIDRSFAIPYLWIKINNFSVQYNVLLVRNTYYV